MKEDDVQNDEEEYQLPPVQLPKIPLPPQKKSAKDLVVVVPDLFNEKIIKIDESSIETLEFLNDGSLLAIGLSNGNTKVLSVAQGNVQFLLKGQDHSPVSGLACNPNSSHLRHALMTTHSDGTLQYWHATSGQLLFSKKYDEMLQACQISPEGTHYAFSGEHGKIRFGLLNKGEPEQVQAGHLGKHDNRVFCLKWNPEDNNIMASGGWDRSVYFWDLRIKTSIKQVFGYYIGGQAIDFNGHQVLLGDNKPEHPLRIYDFKADKITTVPWALTSQQQSHYTTGVLSCFFTNSKSLDIVACTSKNQIRYFKENNLISEHYPQQQIQSEDEDNKLRLYCMQHDKNTSKVVTGWSDGLIRWLSF